MAATAMLSSMGLTGVIGATVHRPRCLTSYVTNASLASGAATTGFQHNFHLHTAGLSASNTFIGGIPTNHYIVHMMPRRRSIPAASLIPVLALKTLQRVSFLRAVGSFRPWTIMVQAVHSEFM